MCVCACVCAHVCVLLHVFVPALLSLIFPTWFHFMLVCTCAYTMYHVAVGVCPSLYVFVCALSVSLSLFLSLSPSLSMHILTRFYVYWHIT